MTTKDPKDSVKSVSPSSPSGFFAEVERSGIYFIRSQKRYLRWSMIFPIYNLVVQIAYILALPQRAPPGMLPQPGPPLIFDIFTPPIVLIVFSLFAFIHYLFLRTWNSKVLKYDAQKGRFDELLKSSPVAEEKTTDFVTFSQLLYDILNHMAKIRIIFFILNVTFVLTMGHFIQAMLIDLRLIPTFFPPAPPIIQFFDYLNQIGLIFYLIYQWKIFLRWNRKNAKIPAFEKQVYEEVFPTE